jgi:hypothetical protein
MPAASTAAVLAASPWTMPVLAKYNRVPCLKEVGHLVQNLNNDSKVSCASMKALQDEQKV